MPDRLINPTVGLMPTIALTVDGPLIDPFVSEPMETAHKLAAVAAPEPLLDPPACLSRT
jgi:hypothetical protein